MDLDTFFKKAIPRIFNDREPMIVGPWTEEDDEVQPIASIADAIRRKIPSELQKKR